MTESESTPNRPKDDSNKTRFDERLWPVTTLLVILAIFVAGMIISNGNFDTTGVLESAKHLSRNAWVQLLALVTIVGGLIWLAAAVKNKIQIRRMQFSACVGLLLHIVMLIGLQYADEFVTTEVAIKKPVTRRPFKIVSLPSDGKKLTRRILEQGLNRPVEAQGRDDNVRIDRSERQSDDSIPELAENPPVVEPDSQPVEVVPMELKRAEESAASAGEMTLHPLSSNALLRQAMPAPGPVDEPITETPPAGGGQPAPQIEAVASSRTAPSTTSIGEQPQPEIVSPSGLGPNPAFESTTASRRDTASNGPDLARPRARPEMVGRQPRQLSDAMTPATAEPPTNSIATSSPGELESSSGAGRTQDRRPLPALRGGTPLGVGSEMSQPNGTGQAGRGQLARREQGEGAPGVGNSLRPRTTPFSNRSPIVVDAGGGGIGNETVLQSDLGSAAGSGNGSGNGAGRGRSSFSSGPQESAGSSMSSRRPAGLPGGLVQGSGGGGGSGNGPGIGGSGAGTGGPGLGDPGGGSVSTGTGSALAGIPSRRSLPQNEAISGGGGRFILDKASAGPALDARADPAPAFRQRGREGRGRLADSLGGSAESERAVELGLDFLARHQFDDGHWGLHDFAAGRRGYQQAGEGTIEADTAATGLALLAFLGAGYSHFDDRHGKTVDAGLRYLVQNQKLNGDLFTSGTQNVWLYSHGIASIALCEAYGMTRDEKLREPAQKCLDFIVACQHPTLGGWRYSPRAESDTSVSGWQMMALKSGELAGLKVPASAYAGVSKWLDHAQSQEDASQYAYLPRSQFPHQRVPSRAMTAEALLMRLYLGWDRANENVIRGADYLQANLPQVGRADYPQRDTYYWYYATQVMFQMQGEHWAAWNGRLRPLLVNSQVQEGAFAGSWEPNGPVPDRWGPAGGRLYVTSIHLLMLEVYYRHLPLYKTLTEARPAE